MKTVKYTCDICSTDISEATDNEEPLGISIRVKYHKLSNNTKPIGYEYSHVCSKCYEAMVTAVTKAYNNKLKQLSRHGQE